MKNKYEDRINLWYVFIGGVLALAAIAVHHLDLVDDSFIQLTIDILFLAVGVYFVICFSGVLFSFICTKIEKFEFIEKREKLQKFVVPFTIVLYAIILAILLKAIAKG